MKLSSLSKRCMAMVLSLSMIVGQGFLPSLNSVAYAAGSTSADTGSAEGNISEALAKLGLKQQEDDATQSVGSPFELSDEDMPYEPKELLDEYYTAYGEEAISPVALGSDSGQTSSTPDIILNSKGADYGNSFTIKYTTVSNKQKKITFTKKMEPDIDILMTPYGNDTWFGFKVLSISVSVKDKSGNYIMFYADEIVSSDFYITVDMELSNGDRLKDLEYTATPDDNDGWASYTDAVLTSGRYSIKVRKPYGAYLAMRTKVEKAATTGKALLIVLDGDLGSVPLEDMQALKTTLSGTHQFKEDDIEILEVPSEDESGTYKKKVWEWIDENAASGNELSFIGYSGHGGYNDDGTSELSLGGDNTISGVELKQHVSKLKGKVMLLFDCCFSGGMIMPTMESGDELNELGIDDMGIGSSELNRQAQEYGDELINSFIDDFNNEEGINSLSAAGSSELEYYIYTAASAYETGLQSTLGGQLTTVFCYGLGYERGGSSYNIFAADIDGNYEVSASELADYVSSCSIESKPVVYYPNAKADEALFTYDKTAGVPAILSVTATTDTNVQMDGSGKVSVPVKVTNYSSKAVTFDAGAFPANNIGEVRPGAIDLSNYTDRKGQAFYTEGINKHEIAAGGTWTGKLTFTDVSKQYFAAGGRYLIKVWGIANGATKAFAVTDFYIGTQQTAAAVDETGKKAFAIKQPAQVYKAEDAKEVSAIVPLNVTFDTEPIDKKGYAALTLTATAYDLGNSSSYESDSDDGKITDAGTKAEAILSNGTTIYTNVRPTYVRNDMYTANGTTSSTYSYAFDVSGLNEGHYYALQVLCEYDDGTSQKKTTFIKVTDKETADESAVIIGESFIYLNNFGKSWEGIKIGKTWTEYGERATVKEVTDTLTEYLNDYNYKYDSQNKDINYSIYDANASDKCVTGWWKYNKVKKEFEEMQEGDHFESGTSYMNRIILKIDDGYNAKFSEGTVFTVTGHSLVGEATDRLSADHKTATIYVLHTNINISEDEEYIKVCRAGGTTPLTATDELKIGDQIDIYVKDGYSISTSEAGRSLKKIDTENTPYSRYEVVQGKGTEIQLIVYKEGSGASTDDCCCATIFYTHDISDNYEAINSITAPTKTFYDYYGDKQLDLNGAEVTYYAQNKAKNGYESKTIALDDFMQNTGAKLYAKIGDKYLEWDDSYLKDLGMSYIYLLYNDKYIKAFDVETGYEQGARFSISGDFTYNADGSVNYIADDTIKNGAVLSLSTNTVIKGNCQGYINITHNAIIKSENTNASDYSKTYFTNGASIRYMIPYPENLDVSENTIFNVKDENKNVPVKLEKGDDGLLITAYRNGSFVVNIDVGGKGGPGDCGNGSSSSGSETTATNRSYGTWQASTVNAGDANTDTVTLYRFMLYNGEYATGWRLIRYKGADCWFLFGEDGYMLAGWAKDKDAWYYLKPDGTMATGWVLDNGAWYYLDADGHMLTGWQLVNGSWYYLDANGHMLTGWQLINGIRYYLGTDGAWTQTEEARA